MRSTDLPKLEILNSRILDAPRALVFGAFEDPARLARWWGPKGFSNTINEFDFRPGGYWRYVMHGPDGANYENESQFVEIAKPEKINLLHLRPLHRFELAMTYADVPGNKTALSWRMVFENTAENQRLKEFLFAANEQNLDRLAAILANTKAISAKA
jgi:uncharacterized protein YndB with AHSA1/START domain